MSSCETTESTHESCNGWRAECWGMREAMLVVAVMLATTIIVIMVAAMTWKLDELTTAIEEVSTATELPDDEFKPSPFLKRLREGQRLREAAADTPIRYEIPPGTNFWIKDPSYTESQAKLDQYLGYLLRRDNKQRAVKLLAKHPEGYVVEQKQAVAPVEMLRKASTVEEMLDGDALVVIHHELSMDKNKKLWIDKDAEGIHIKKWKKEDDSIHAQIVVYKNVEGYHVCVPLKDFDHSEAALSISDYGDDFWNKNSFRVASISRVESDVHEVAIYDEVRHEELKLRERLLEIFDEYDTLELKRMYLQRLERIHGAAFRGSERSDN